MENKIYLIGDNNLSNNLLVFFIKEKIGLSCVRGPDLAIVPPVTKTGKTGYSVILWDCLSNSLDLLWNNLENGFMPSNYNCHLALLNVGSEHAINRSSVGKGVRGIFFEKNPPELIEKGIRFILDDKLWLSRDIMSEIIFESPERTRPENGKSKLTFREKQILGYIQSGLTNKDIAQKLCISDNTVKTHVYNLFQKIGVPNRLQAALWATKNM